MASSFLTKNINQSLSKLKFLSFMTKVNPNNGNETKSDIFPWTCSNLTSFFIFHISKTLIICISQFLCKSDLKQVK